MTLAISDEVALLAIAIERAGDDPDQIVLCRADFEALWLKFKRDTQGIEDCYIADCREEFALQLAKDRA